MMMMRAGTCYSNDDEDDDDNNDGSVNTGSEEGEGNYDSAQYEAMVSNDMLKK